MKNLKYSIIDSIKYISVFLIGFILAKFIYFPKFEISKTIDLVDILTLIVTILVAILITTVFEKRNNNYRNEKDLIIKRIGNIFEIVDKLQIESISGKIQLTEVASSIKRINKALSSLYNIVGKCHFIINPDIKKQLNENLAVLRKILTNTPIHKEEQTNLKDLPIEIKDGIVFFNKNRISQIEVNFENLKDLLLELQIDINSK